ncbi:MAG: FHA domain-containing protein [Gammaproteobacteria bacterium]|nr:FHA domain-containing protein [Gammaproteobacteria bacterium]
MRPRSAASQSATSRSRIRPLAGITHRVARVSGKYVIKDEGSTNGIYVKGRRVNEHILEHEDVVMISETVAAILIVEADASIR